ncbi:MAG: PorT family protein, partial [Sediminibacterium sp.]|nr:PorT family protein [Sediminibacterium sp.]
ILLLLLAGTTAAYIFLNGNPVILEDTETVQLPLPNSSNTKQPTLINKPNEAKTNEAKTNETKPNQTIDSIYEKTEAPTVVENSTPKMVMPSDKKTTWKLDRKNMTQSFKQSGSVFPFEQSIQYKKQQTAAASTNNIKEEEITDPEEAIESYETSLKAGNALIKQKRNLSALFNREMTTKNHASSFKNVVICPTDRKIRNTDWGLEVFVSPDMPFKTVTNNTASPQLLSRKDSSESLKLGFSAGFRIVKPLNDHFAIKTGLQYSQINEHFTYRTENETRTTTVVTVRAIIRAPGDTLLVRDTSTLTQIGYKTNTVKNRFRSLDIPVLASYQFGNDDLSIGLTAGVIVNLSSWYQGVILDSSLTAVPLSKETNMVYKSNIGLGLYAGLTVSKRINYATQLFFEPYLRYNLSNMTNPEAAFNQRFSIGGLAMGLRFNLNKR